VPHYGACVDTRIAQSRTSRSSNSVSGYSHFKRKHRPPGGTALSACSYSMALGSKHRLTAALLTAFAALLIASLSKSVAAEECSCWTVATVVCGADGNSECECPPWHYGRNADKLPCMHVSSSYQWGYMHVWFQHVCSCASVSAHCVHRFTCTLGCLKHWHTMVLTSSSNLAAANHAQPCYACRLPKQVLG